MQAKIVALSEDYSLNGKPDCGAHVEGPAWATNPLRILIANEPRSYREAIAGTLRVLRPDARVTTAEQEGLDLEVRRSSPEMVVCSRLSPAVENTALVWVELYPEGASLALIGIGGQRSTVADLQLAHLVSLVDRTEGLARAGQTDAASL